MGKGRRGNQPQNLLRLGKQSYECYNRKSQRSQGAKPVIGNDVIDSPEPEMHALHLPLTLLNK